MNRTNEIIKEGIDVLLEEVRTLIRTHPDLRDRYEILTEEDLRIIATTILKERVERAIQAGFRSEYTFN